MTGQTFCANCKSRRPDHANFCPSCGGAFDAPPTHAIGHVAAASTGSGWSGKPAILAGLAWLAASAVMGYIAYQQSVLSQQMLAAGDGDRGLGGYAAWNAVSGIVTFYLAVRWMTGPSRGFMGRSIAWSVLSLGSGVLQTGSGGFDDFFVFATIASATGGVLSLLARLGMSPDLDGPVEIGGVEPVSSGIPSTPGMPATARSGRISAEGIMVVLIAAAALGGGALLVNRPMGGEAAANDAPPSPSEQPATPQATMPPARNAYDARIGEVVGLRDGNAAPVGSITVVKAGKPSKLAGSSPRPGYRYIAARVKFVSMAAWSYSRLDWAAHDARRLAYEPLPEAPNPPLKTGALDAGHQAEGWVVFEVPRNVREVWLDYRPLDQSVIFSVQID